MFPELQYQLVLMHMDELRDEALGEARARRARRSRKRNEDEEAEPVGRRRAPRIALRGRQWS